MKILQDFNLQVNTVSVIFYIESLPSSCHLSRRIVYFSLFVVWQKLAFPAILACYCAYRITRISAAFGTKKLITAAPKLSARRPNEQTQKTLILLL